MKIISKVVNTPAYTAVFALRTPAFDHSGLSHLSEHMVFRGSKAYESSHELFVINTLLPASLNASTHNGFTFYFIESPCKRLFVKLIDYLYAGLLQTDYVESELILERDGVIYQELKMYERNHEYYMQAYTKRSDTSKDSVYHYGGYTDTISSNSLNDVSIYKQAIYRPENITLYLTGPEELSLDLPSQLQRFIDQKNALAQLTQHPHDANNSHDKCVEDSSKHSNSNLEHLKLRTKVKTKLGAKRYDNSIDESSTKQRDSLFVITWRIHAAYLTALCGLADSLMDMLVGSEHVIIEEDINEDGLFAFRIVSYRPEEVTRSVVEQLSKLELKRSVFELPLKQQSLVVKSCMNDYLKQNLSLPVAQELHFYLNRYKISPLEILNTISADKDITKRFIGSEQEDVEHASRLNIRKQEANKKTKPLAIEKASIFAATFKPQLSLKNVPALPGLFKAALTKMNTKHFLVVDEVNWLLLMTTEQSNKIRNIATNAMFWLPRLNGECYAMGVGRHNGRYYIYGAEDKHASQRSNYLDTFMEHE